MNTSVFLVFSSTNIGSQPKAMSQAPNLEISLWLWPIKAGQEGAYGSDRGCTSLFYSKSIHSKLRKLHLSAKLSGAAPGGFWIITWSILN